MTSASAEFPFSDLIQQPTRVTAAVEERGRVILRRRNSPDLALTRATDLSELEGFARLLSRTLEHVPSGEVGDAVGEALPWTRYLTAPGRTEFVGTLPGVVRDCADLGTFAPLDTFMAQWRETAAIQADPELADRLRNPIHNPLGTPVEAP